MPSAPEPATPEAAPKRRGRLWYWAKQLGLLLIIVLGVRLYQQRNLPKGEPPAWPEVRDLDGAPVSLEAYRGAPVMLYFWATWCGVCRVQQHNITAVADDVPVLSVASQSGPPSAVRAYLAERPLGARVVVDPAGALAARFGVGAYPTTFFLDGEGQIRHAEVGYTSELGIRLRMWLAKW